jgi:glycine/D-amino acid oxidase-like deaminating enzyme
MGVLSRKLKGRAWQLRQRTIERFDPLLSELETQTGQTIPCNRDGIVLLRFAEDDDEDGWRKMQAQRHEQGYPLELWDRAQTLAHCPQLTHPTLCGAVYSPRDRQVNPVALTRACLTAAAQNGVEIRYGVKIDEITSLEPNQPILRCGAEMLAVDAAIVTAGLGADSLSAHHEIRPVLGQAWRIRLPETLGQPEFQPVVSGHDIHFVPLGHGEYWLGATVEFEPERIAPQTVFTDPPPHPVENAVTRALWQGAIALCDPIQEAEILSHWSGWRPRPQNQGAPILEPLRDQPHVFVASGHYRNGILLAPATAEVVRDWVMGL